MTNEMARKKISKKMEIRYGCSLTTNQPHHAFSSLFVVNLFMRFVACCADKYGHSAGVKRFAREEPERHASFLVQIHKGLHATLADFEARIRKPQGGACVGPPLLSMSFLIPLTPASHPARVHRRSCRIYFRQSGLIPARNASDPPGAYRVNS